MLIYFSLSILLFILGASLYKGRSFNNRGLFFKNIFTFSLIAVFAILFYFSYQQYQAWSQNKISEFLLPPHQSIGYFLFYVGIRFFGPYLISLLAALLFIFAAERYNQKYEERFFYPEEYYIGATSIFLTGYPGVLFYVIFILIASVILSLIVGRWSLIGERLSLYYLWPAVAIFALVLIEFWRQYLPLWNLLKI